jgi:WD40 repeat protein/transcriptional regulator with XRE-family HTH domain
VDTPHEPESFRSLLLRHRGRSGLTQRDLGARAGVSLRSVQAWEAGDTLPSAERLQGLIRAVLDAGGLTPGAESTEARGLWSAVEREVDRPVGPFDAEWFAGLLGAPPAPQASVPSSLDTAADRAQDWGEAPDTAGFVGRAVELAQLQSWVVEDRCKLVTVLGIGGIGKTSLAAWAAHKAAASFERVYWRSLRNAPPVTEWLAGAIGFLSEQGMVPPLDESEQIAALLQILRARRCLVVLDNSETLFEPGQGEGRYRAGMDGYGRVLQAVGQTRHQSCLVLTSREAPPELSLVPGARALELHGLGVAESQALLADKQLIGDAQAWLSLVDHYGGNGLALKIVGETIHQVYNGDVAAFLAEAIATYGTVFGGVRRLLDVQAERLSPIERDVLMRMAVEREPMHLADLSASLPPMVVRTTMIDAIGTLLRRSLVERAEGEATFTLQSMVLEYITDRLVETVAGEIERGEPLVLVEQPLIKAQAKDYVRQTQERLIGAPIIRRLTTDLTDSGPEQGLLALLDGWRGRPPGEQGYGPGNVVNLLRLVRGDLRRMDLSQLCVRQAYLQEAEAQDASLEGTELTETVLAEAFGYPTEVTLSADGAFLAAAMPTGEVRVWRVVDRTPLLTLRGHTGAVWGVGLARDGRLVASGGVDGTVRLWDAASERLIATLRGHSGAVRAIAVSGDGRLVASGGVDGTVRLSDTAHGQLGAPLPGESGMVWSIALSRDARWVASGSVDGMVRVWEAQSGQPATTLAGHTGAVYGVGLSGDGRMVVSGGADGTVRLWDATSGELMNTLLGHTGSVWRVAFSEDGRLTASVGDDGIVRIWDVSSGQLLSTLQGHTGLVWSVSLSGDGRLVASGGDDGTVRLWETDKGQRVATLRGSTPVLHGVALSGDGSVVASGGTDRLVRLWEASSGRLLATLRGHSGLVWGVALSEDGRLVASCSVDATVRLWEVSGGRLLSTLQGHTGGVWAVALSADGKLAASGGADGTVRLWQTDTGQPLAVLEGHTGLVRGVAFSGDGRVVASSGDDATVRIWDASSGQLVATLQGHAAGIPGVALSEDGRLVASASMDGTVRLWEALSGQPIATLNGHTAAAWKVAVSGDGRLVASSSWDETVRLWDSASGELLATLQGHAGAVNYVALAADGGLLASGGDDGIARLWDAETGVCLRTLSPDRYYERLNITGLTGVTEAQRAALLALGAVEATA